MQRNSPYKNFVSYLFWSIFFIFYGSLASIYLILPPLMAPLFIVFKDALNKKESMQLFFLIVVILVFEAQEGFMTFTLLIYFLIVDKFIVPKIQQSINAKKLQDILYVVLAYFGYILFYTLLSQIFLLPLLDVNLYFIYYIVFEYFLVSVLL